MNGAWAGAQGCSHCEVSRSTGFGDCPRCGRRFLASDTLPELPYWLDRRLGAWLRRKDLREVALCLAFVPLFVVAPVLSASMFAMRFYKAPGWETVTRWKLVLIVSALNIVVSVYLLGQISELFWDLGAAGIRAIFGGIGQEAPPAPPSAAIPV